MPTFILPISGRYFDTGSLDLQPAFLDHLHQRHACTIGLVIE